MYLHQLTDLGIRIQEEIENNPTFDITKALVDFQGEFNDKVLELGKVYLNTMAEANVYYLESKRLKMKQDSIERRAEDLRQYVEREMKTLGVEAIKGDTFTVKFRKLPNKVEVIAKLLVPHEYCKHIEEDWQPIKDKIEEVYKAKGNVEGTEYKTDRRKLEIK